MYVFYLYRYLLFRFFLKRIINGFIINFAIISLEYFNRLNIIFLKHRFFHIILVTCLPSCCSLYNQDFSCFSTSLSKVLHVYLLWIKNVRFYFTSGYSEKTIRLLLKCDSARVPIMRVALKSFANREAVGNEIPLNLMCSTRWSDFAPYSPHCFASHFVR